MIAQTTDIELPFDSSLDSDPAAELRMHAKSIRDWQLAEGLSDVALLREHPPLGSTKTFINILNGNTDELKLENWLPKYRSVANQVATATSTQDEEIIYPSLSNTAAACLAVEQMVACAHKKQRLVVLQAPTGSGKSCSLDLLASRYPGRTFRIEADETWKSATSALCGIAIAIGAMPQKELTDSFGKFWLRPQKGELLQRILTRLGDQRVILMIDEGHHMTGETLNFLKTILNRSRCFIVIAAIATIWDKLSANSKAEADQIILNRGSIRLQLAAPSPEDVKAYLQARASVILDKKQCEALSADSAAWGSFAYLRRVSEELLSLPLQDRNDPTAITAARTQIKKALNPNAK